MDLDLPSDAVQAALHRIRDELCITPVHRSRLLNQEAGVDLFLKCENFQRTGSFKVRGVLNYLGNAAPAELERGVVTVSAGNHAQALAWGAQRVGVPAVVAMPRTAPATKIAASRDTYGADVRIAEDGAAAFRLARQIAESEGLHFVHPFDHQDVLAGQGTVGLELLDQAPDLDVILVPVGGGGLIAGILAAVAERGAPVKVVGVEPESAAAMAASVAAGRAVTLEQVGPTEADGLAAPMAGPLCFELVRRYAHDIVTVSEEGIASALNLMLTRTKLLVEPAAAAGLAAILEGRVDVPVGARVGIVLSGGNADPERLGAICARVEAEGCVR